MRPIVKKIAWPPNQWKSVSVDDILDSRSAVAREPFLSRGFYRAASKEVKNDLVFCSTSPIPDLYFFFELSLLFSL